MFKVLRTWIHAFFRLNIAPTIYLKLIKPRYHLDVRKYSFAHGVIDNWKD